MGVRILVSALCLLLGCVPGEAATWSWRWQPAGDEAVPTAEVCLFKYGKDWAYAVEIDDGGIGALTTVQPLLAKFSFTNAPPQAESVEGKALPFVGGTAVIVNSLGTGKKASLQWEDLRELERLGWGVLNHSYAHEGRTWGNPPHLLTPEEIRRDLFWSQTLLATELGRAPTHFVYPNGYVGYRDYLLEFGLDSASRVGAPSANMMVYRDESNHLDLTRAHLDDKPWANRGKSEPLWSFPEGGPNKGSVHIDFAHGINADPESADYQLWEKRLSIIASRYGAGGQNNVWSAPTDEIMDYVKARRAAEVQVQRGQVTVRIPDDLPGSSLTVRLEGLDAGIELASPPGGAVYREGETVWLTTPVIGQAGAALPEPRVTRIYAGEVKDMQWDRPVAIAAVRLFQAGPVAEDFTLGIEAVTAEGIEPLVTGAERKLGRAWGKWRLYATVPNGPPIAATQLRVSRDNGLRKMEVWVVAP